MGLFAHLFHIRPWEIQRLEHRHYLTLRAEADQWLKAQQQARSSGGVRGGH